MTRKKYFLKKIGFTLIEVLLVVVLLGVIAAVSLPNFRQTYARLKLKQAADQISYMMRYMQTRAIHHNVMGRLEFDPAYKHYWFSEMAIEDDGEENEEKEFKRIAGRWGRTFDVPDEVRVETAQPAIQFFPDGKIDKARIYVCEKADCWTVSTQEQRGYVDVFDYRLEDQKKEDKTN